MGLLWRAAPSLQPLARLRSAASPRVLAVQKRPAKMEALKMEELKMEGLKMEGLKMEAL